ncbi:hypothetical protein [Dethiosulfovibrio peptidovorans]|uniref:hypothetical protein n=1 Tax=Dethiosulfovibrio peptidovorans TaxID=47055 RepID=UPI00019E63C9|nr:hypothetical protein [Dethiosulfovibrio peptidovorans]
MYVYSGTGNTLHLAKKLSERIGKHEIHNMVGLMDEDVQLDIPRIGQRRNAAGSRGIVPQDIGEKRDKAGRLLFRKDAGELPASLQPAVGRKAEASGPKR